MRNPVESLIHDAGLKCNQDRVFLPVETSSSGQVRAEALLSNFFWGGLGFESLGRVDWEGGCNCIIVQFAVIKLFLFDNYKVGPVVT